MGRFFKSDDRGGESSGYIAILVAVAAPMLLLFMKYIMDRSTYNAAQMEMGSSGELQKKCAKAAVLKVAEKWNPGLTLLEQREALLRIADEVYNAAPIYDDRVVGLAIPGLDLEVITFIGNSFGFSPLAINRRRIPHDPSQRVVEYADTEGKYANVAPYSNDYGGVLPIFQFYDSVYRMPKNPRFVLEDTISSVALTGVQPTLMMRLENFENFLGVAINGTVKAAAEVAGTDATRYRARVVPEDTKVQISVEDDKIMVQTDNDVGYAVPAECNVDIVLAIPTSASAHIPEANSAQSTPVYFIAQGYRKFLKDHFLFTRGVNVGLIPYSGNCSLPVDRMQDWTEQPPQFVCDNFLSYVNVYQPRLMGAFLYGTMSKSWPGSTGRLDFQEDSWGRYATSVTNVMCRTGTTSSSDDYGGNVLCHGDILSTDNPQSNTDNSMGKMFSEPPIVRTGSSKRFRRKPCVNCHICYANLLNMRIEKDFVEQYYPNPYHIVELQADVMRIVDLLSVFYPVTYPSNNESNFLFIAFSWANNLFSDWTADPRCDAIDTAVNSPGQLSRQSKMMTDRKKAVILVVNKPDHFEPGELTYLGFDNDFSEVPMVESDKIDFSIDYSDTTKKFLDGTSYDGIIQGAKKTLKYTTTGGTLAYNTTKGRYEYTNSEAASGRLSFPEKAMLKIVVEPEPRTANWTTVGSNTADDAYNGAWYNLCAVENTLYALEVTYGQLVKMDLDATSPSWIKVGSYTADNAHNGLWYNLCVVLNTLYSLEFSSGQLVKMSLGATYPAWLKVGSNKADNAYSGTWYNLCAVGNTLYALERDSGQLVKMDLGASTPSWTKVDSNTADSVISGSWFNLCAVGNTLYSFSGQLVKMDLGATFPYWTKVGSNTPDSVCGSKGYWHSLCAVGNTLYALDYYYGMLVKIDLGASPLIWTRVGSNTINNAYSANGAWENLCAVGNTLYALETYSGQLMKMDIAAETELWSLTFGNVTSSDGQTTAGPHNVSKRTSFYIAPSQISDTKIDGNYYVDLNMTDIRLISAEITNAIINYISATYNNVDILDFTRGQTSSEVLSNNTYTEAEPATDTINFANGSTAGAIMSYSTIYGLIAYNSGKGLDCSLDCSDVAGKLTLSRQPDGNISLTIDAILAWTKVGDNTADSAFGSSLGYWSNLCAVGNTLYALEMNSGQLVMMDLGASTLKWSKVGSNTANEAHSGSWYNLCAVGNTLYAIDYDYGQLIMMDLASTLEWTDLRGLATESAYTSIDQKNRSWYNLCAVENTLYAQENLYGHLVKIDLGASFRFWALVGDIAYSLNASSLGSSLCAVGNTLYALTEYSGQLFKMDLGASTPSWTKVGSNTADDVHSGRWQNLCAVGNTLYALEYESGQLFKMDLGATTPSWATVGSNIADNAYSGSWRNLCAVGNTLYALERDYGQLVMIDLVAATIKIGSGSSQTISSKTTIEIPASSLTANSDGSYYVDLAMTDISLISASCSYYKPKIIDRITTSRQAPIYLTASGSGSLKIIGTGTSTHSVSGKTTIEIPASQFQYNGNNGWYIDIDKGNSITLVSAVIKYPENEVVHDLIEFADSTTSKNPVHYLNYSGSGSVSGGLYVASGTGTLQTSWNGDVELTVAPLPGSSSTFRFTSGSDTSTKTIAGIQTFLISASELASNNNSVSFSATNVVLLRAKFTASEHEAITYPTIPHTQTDSQTNSQTKVSRLANFLETPPPVCSNGVTFAENSGSGSFSHSGDVAGDFFCLMEDIGQKPLQMSWSGSNSSSDISTDYSYMPGISRTLIPYRKDGPNNYCNFCTPGASGQQYKMIYGGFTLPINAALYYHRSGDGEAPYSFVPDGVSDINGVACRKVTLDACKKLKDDWGDNVRIYIIKYKEINGNYSYLDNCTPSNYIYPAENENELIEKLNLIATNIKEFADYKYAKNVNNN